MSAPDLPAELVEAWSKLGPRARQVVLAVAERLAVGAERYQDDLSPGRNWRREATQESLDCAVYLARELVE